MRTYAELKEADFQEMTNEEDSFVKRITNIAGYCLHSKLDASKYMEEVVELDKKNGSTFIREMFFKNLKETFAKLKKSGRLSTAAIEAIKDWDNIEASFDAYIYSGETTIDYSILKVAYDNASSFLLMWEEEELLFTTWMILDFSWEFEINAPTATFGYIH